MKSVLVLGGTGMLGSMLVDVLSQADDLNVTATARDSVMAAGFRRCYPSVEWQEFAFQPGAATDVPLFDNEESEAEFWSENRPDLRLMEAAIAGGSDAESITITLRMDPRMLARIKRLARSRYLNYQSMIKQWLSERMEHELREK